jgi:hypothetical protein
MAININVQIARAIAQENLDGLTLVIFKNARKQSGVTESLVSVKQLSDLTDNFEEPTTLAEARELHTAEYLVRAGVNLLCYSTAAVGTIGTADITTFGDVELFGYKLIVAPYVYLTASNTESNLLSFAKENDVQLFLDLDPEVTVSGVGAIVTALGVTVSAKLEVFANGGLPNFRSAFSDIPTEFLDSSILVDFESEEGEEGENGNITITQIPIAPEERYYGILASAAAVARKARLLLLAKPWLPVAGETNGIVNEFAQLYRKLTTVEKEALQSNNINVLITKVGVGNVFVSQNTMFPSDTPSDALIRSHVVTETLYIKRLLKKEAEKLKFAPNNLKTWNSFSLKTQKLFKQILDDDGIEDFSIQVGLGITMTAQDITEGKFKAVVTFLPIRVIEEITFNIILQEQEESYVIDFIGGAL